MPKKKGPVAAYQRQQLTGNSLAPIEEANNSFKIDVAQPSLLEEQWDGLDDESFDMIEKPSPIKPSARHSSSFMKDVLGRKENLPAK